MTTVIKATTPGAPTSVTRDAPALPIPEGVDVTRRVLRQRQVGKWILTVVVLILFLNFAQTLFTNKSWEWPRFSFWLFSPAIVGGLGVTVLVTALSTVVSFVLGVAVALLRLSNNAVLSFLSWLYVWLFRSLPVILVLIFLYNIGNLYPELGIGIPFGPQLQFKTVTLLSDIALGVVGLSLIEVAYSSEVVRSGLLSVDQGQHEAAKALGIPRFRQFTRIVLPQALRSIVPSYVNQVMGLVKSASLLFYVGILDVFGVSENLGSTYPSDIIPLLTVASFWYLVLSSILSIVQYYVERHYARGAFRILPPTPFQRVRGAFTSLTGARR